MLNQTHVVGGDHQGCHWERQASERACLQNHSRGRIEDSLNSKILQRIINYQLFDIERGDIQTMKELEVYAENTRSLLLYTNLHLLRIDSSDALTAASHLGRCIGICDVLKKIPFYLAKHRSYIPTEVLLKVTATNSLIHPLFFSITCTLRRFGIHDEKVS